MRYNHFYLYSYMKTKTATLNLRISPYLKKGIRLAADQEHRSVANMIEMLIRRHCVERGIKIIESRNKNRENKNG